MKEFQVRTSAPNEMVDVTALIEQAVAESNITEGSVLCFVPHTTAAITINENADPSVKRDILYKLAKEIPRSDGYHHAEGNSDAHVKAVLVGSSEQIIINNGQLVLGTWQGIFFCEFDGPRNRKLLVQVSSIA